MRRLFWWIGQLIPRTYWSHHHAVLSRTETDMQTEPRFVIWKMWLGRSYDVVEIKAQH